MADADPFAPMPADAVARLRLIRTSRVGPVTYRQLVARFGSAAAALDALPDLARAGGGAPLSPAPAALAEREIAAVRRLGARHLFGGTPGYPALLAELETAPPALIVQGDAGLMGRRCVAMVGARNASAAACRFARQLAAELAAEGAVVVSGLARGIDTQAHLGAGTATVAVIAGGIDVPFPPENAELQRRLGEAALVVAEQPPGTEPRARHFPYRNRIIAGLARGTVVVEAAPKSGSLITARLAAEAGREVMAVPGHPLDPRAGGCNLLIREGATLVTGAADILELVRPLDPRAEPAVRAPAAGYDAGPPGEPGERERRAVAALLGPVPVPVDELVRQAELPPSTVQAVLLELELAGRLERHAGARVSGG